MFASCRTFGFIKKFWLPLNFCVSCEVYAEVFQIIVLISGSFDDLHDAEKWIHK